HPKAAGGFDIVVVDEAHNISDKDESAYRKIFAALAELRPNRVIVGFTATPFRTGSGLIYGEGRLFADVAYQKSLKSMIDESYLVRPLCPKLDTEIDTHGLRTVAGDFSPKMLAERAESSPLVRQCLDVWQHHAAERRSSLFFCVSIAHAEMVKAEIEARGIGVEMVTGKTPGAIRDARIKRFSQGLLPALINVGVLTEGTDIPNIDCIVLMRPTKSLTLFIQMVGRGLRLSPETGKQNCLLLDFGGCLERFGPIDIAQPPEKRATTSRTKECPECGALSGFFKRKCVECGFEFQPQPIKVCDHCGEENAPSAAVCIGCGEVFEPDLENQAHNGAAMSDELRPKHEVMQAQGITTSIGMSRKTGREYLRMTFDCGPLNRFNKIFCLGYPGYAGKKALRDMQKLAPNIHTDIRPATAHDMHQQGALIEGRVTNITVDINSKYQDVTHIQIERFQEAG
ncbi:MAG: helicase-related protein, partial [Pseudomonadota bacterium]